MGNSNHLEMLAMITLSMLPCITWRGMWSLACYCLERVTRQFGYDQDIPYAPSSDKTDRNKAMEDNGQWVLVCPPIPGMAEEEFDQAGTVGEEFGQEAAGGVRATANKPSKAKVPTPSKAKTAKDKDTSRDNESDESSWGNPNPKVIEQIKRLRPIRGGRCLGEKYYDSSASFQLAASNEGIGSIPIPSDNKVPSKTEEAKWVEALAVNMEEALMNLEVRRKILASKIAKPPLPDDILNVDWSYLTSFKAESAKKAKANDVRHKSLLREARNNEDSARGDGVEGAEKGKAKATIGVSKEKGNKVTEVTSSDSSESSNHKSNNNDASFENGNGKMDTGMPTMSSVKKMAGPGETKHGGQQSATPAKSSKIDDLAMRLLKSLDEMNEDRDVSLAWFGLVPLGGLQVVGRFTMPAMLEPWACHMLDIFTNLTMRSKAKKVVVDDAFSILCATMQHMEVTPFAKNGWKISSISVEMPLTMLRVLTSKSTPLALIYQIWQRDILERPSLARPKVTWPRAWMAESGCKQRILQRCKSLWSSQENLLSNWKKGWYQPRLTWDRSIKKRNVWIPTM
ncbi:hypothetical protein SLEP1_g24620 [Rubroshorea leprosula]|uniref:Uncharacterized protein n=1 Tax=Rubroshorea leprosula TaxID=152421 RepID=A0AAV5JJD8_9ROSI|nr:hypothetical protein SLEP1_g24620 [Rubroshorea leprosula]